MEKQFYCRAAKNVVGHYLNNVEHRMTACFFGGALETVLVGDDVVVVVVVDDAAAVVASTETGIGVGIPNLENAESREN